MSSVCFSPIRTPTKRHPGKENVFYLHLWDILQIKGKTDKIDCFWSGDYEGEFTWQQIARYWIDSSMHWTVTLLH